MTHGEVLRVEDVRRGTLEVLLKRYELELIVENDTASITGSFWGDPEAGIVGRKVYVHCDTPIHSLLHETGHIICMSESRRSMLNRDAGGDDLEETAVCYLQIILADELEGVGRARLMRDMDAWGYSFRAGNTLDWFHNDAGDAVEFLLNHQLVTQDIALTFELRR